MLRGMQTMNASDLVNSSFEACAEFAAADATPVCAGCGWLEADHTDRHDHDAEVHALRTRPVAARPKRLAS